MRNELTEEQITTLMQAIPRAEMVDRLRKENERMRKENERMRKENERMRKENERLRAANKQLVDGIDTITRRKQEEIERLREALREALSGLRYWVPQTAKGLVERNRIMQRVEEALEAKP